MTDFTYPDDLRYTAEHEWVRVEGDVARVGITSFAQDALGDIVYVTLPEQGAQLSAGQTCGEVESTKSVSDIYAPVGGTGRAGCSSCGLGTPLRSRSCCAPRLTPLRSADSPSGHHWHP